MFITLCLKPKQKQKTTVLYLTDLDSILHQIKKHLIFSENLLSQLTIFFRVFLLLSIPICHKLLRTVVHLLSIQPQSITATMCIQEAEQVGLHMDNPDNRRKSWLSRCDHLQSHMENCDKVSSFNSSSDWIGAGNSLPLESICEDKVVMDRKQNLQNFALHLRSGEWSDIGGRPYMEDTHICIKDLAKNFGSKVVGQETISFYGVFDGHGGKSAAEFVRDHLPRIIVEDADFPLELEKVVTRSYMETDTAFAKRCSLESSLSSGTTALTAMVFGRSLLVANAGDCRAVLSRHGLAVEMSKDHRPCCSKERTRIESLGGFIDDDYLNGQLGVTRALGDWHLEGMKETNERGGPLSAVPELKLITLTKEDEFLIIGCDGIWDVFSSQNAVDFARRRLQDHNDVKLCCKEVVEEAMKRGSTDNLTVLMVCFQSEPPPPVIVEKARVRRSISAEGLQNLRCHLQG